MSQLVGAWLVFAALAHVGPPSEVDAAVAQAEAQRVAVMARVSPAVVAVFTPSGEGGGSGVLISPDGLALSNFHVTQEAGHAMKCGLSDGRVYDAVIVGVDPTGDVALLKLFGRDDFPCAHLGNSDHLKVGDWVFAMGNPFLLATDFVPTATYGIVSGLHRYQYPAGTILEYTDCIQTDAAINPGNSGGPLFNSQGELVGINGRGSFEKRGRVNVGVAYAISINQIRNFLGCLKSGRIVDHASLGAVVGTDTNGRVVVRDILPDSDAYRRGLRFGDRITSFAGRPIRTVNAFQNVLGTVPDRWRVPLTYERRGKSHEILVRMASAHRAGELAQLVGGERPPKPEPPQPPEKRLPIPKQEPEGAPDADSHGAAKGTAEVVTQHYEQRAGFANYFYNRQEFDRVMNNLLARGDYRSAGGPWRLIGTLTGGGRIELAISDRGVSATLPAGKSELSLGEDLSMSLDPAGSGGLLAAMAMWRKFLVGGPGALERVEYWGTVPSTGIDGSAAGDERQLDMIEAIDSGVMCRFVLDPTEGHLLSLEFWPSDDTDPCELLFTDYAAVEGGRFFPRQIEVRHGDSTYVVISIKDIELGAPGK